MGEVVVGRTPTPVDHVLVLTLATLLPVPVGRMQIIVRVSRTELAVHERGVEKRLKNITHNELIFIATKCKMIKT